MVYVKPEHPSSASAVATVERVRNHVPFDLQQVDVQGDPALAEKYGADVPVITINGKRAMSGSISEAAFKKRLKKAKARPAGAPAAAEASPTESPPAIVEAIGDDADVPSKVPMPVRFALLLAVVLGFVAIVGQGVVEASYGRGRLARSLLRVKPREGAPPGFALPTLNGPQINSSERFRGKVVFINFWATWCPPCVEEMPSMLRLQAKMADDPRFEMLAISTDEGWTPVRKFFEQKPPFEVLLDAEGKLARTYGTEKFPETYVVVDGRLVGHIIGPRDWDTWYAEAYLRAMTKHGLAL